VVLAAVAVDALVLLVVPELPGKVSMAALRVSGVREHLLAVEEAALQRSARRQSSMSAVTAATVSHLRLVEHLSSMRAVEAALVLPLPGLEVLAAAEQVPTLTVSMRLLGQMDSGAAAVALAVVQRPAATAATASSSSATQHRSLT